MKERLHQAGINTRRRNSWRWLGLGALAALLILWMVAPFSSAGIERYYSRTFYPALASVLVPLTNNLPFSLGGALLIVLPLLWLVSLLLSWRRRASWLGWLGLNLWRTAVGLAAIFLLFVVLWGANYRRAPIEAQFNLNETLSTQAELETLLTTLTAIIQTNADAPRGVQAALSSVARSMQALIHEATGVRPTLPDDVKRLPAGSLILSGSASGIASPLTLEPHVDGALPGVSVVAVGAHELAHVAGYAGEADADFISALAGLRAEDAFARYAVALRLWQNAVWQLPQAEQETYYEQLPEQARQDLDAMLAPFARYRPPAFIQTLQRRSYDRYLRTQGVEAGIRDYSRTVDLLIAAQKKGLL